MQLRFIICLPILLAIGCGDAYGPADASSESAQRGENADDMLPSNPPESANPHDGQIAQAETPERSALELRIHGVEQSTNELSRLETVPAASAVDDVNIFNHTQGDTMTIDVLRDLLNRSRPISPQDPLLAEWHYGPWCIITFDAPAGRYLLRLCLGGLGILQTPDGKRGWIIADQRSNPQSS